MSVSVAEALKIIDQAHAKASELGVNVTVAVVNDAGFLIALARMDGAHSLSPQLAEAH